MMNTTDITYTYNKIRKNFGRQPMFCEVPVHMLDNIYPDVTEQKKYCLRNPVHRESQASTFMKENYINTKTILYQTQGVNHAEGGWPKDIPFADEELTNRYRRRIERDDAYIEAVLNSQSTFEYYVKQNNAIEMYNMYFTELPPVEPVERYSFRIGSAYKDVENRQIASMCWTFEEDSKVVIAYCDKKYPIMGPVNSNLTCYIWDLEHPLAPLLEFLPPAACWQAVCSPVHPAIILGGLEDGRVCIFDVRNVNKGPVMISPEHLAHRDPVSALVYMQSRMNNEFFSGSSDGQCMWWDVRNISDQSEVRIMTVRMRPGEPSSISNSEGVSALQYERSFPTRFLCGTETGLVVNVNRKGKSHHEIMSAVFNAHDGPVKAIHRSPCTSKVFITCGDWKVNIWCDDVQSSPIITGMPHRYQVNDVAWSPQRISSYMSVSADGKFRYWDLLRKYHEPILTFQVSKAPLLKVKANEEGRLIALGDAKGVMYLLSLSDNLVVSGDKDKPLMMQIYDRESRREHILETRVKEIRMKQKGDEEAGGTAHVEDVDGQDLITAAENEYKRIVLEEIRRIGAQASVSSGRGDMRKR